MNNDLKALKAKLSRLSEKQWGVIAVCALVLLFLVVPRGADEDDASSEAKGLAEPESSFAGRTCENLKDDVIAISEGTEAELLEIGKVYRAYKRIGALECRASAEWSRGEGMVEYRVYESESGNIMLSYRQS